jgi:hypothetical protein
LRVVLAVIVDAAVNVVSDEIEVSVWVLVTVLVVVEVVMVVVVAVVDEVVVVVVVAVVVAIHGNTESHDKDLLQVPSSHSGDVHGPINAVLGGAEPLLPSPSNAEHDMPSLGSKAIGCLHISQRLGPSA